MLKHSQILVQIFTKYKHHEEMLYKSDVVQIVFELSRLSEQITGTTAPHWWTLQTSNLPCSGRWVKPVLVKDGYRAFGAGALRLRTHNPFLSCRNPKPPQRRVAEPLLHQPIRHTSRQTAYEGWRSLPRWPGSSRPLRPAQTLQLRLLSHVMTTCGGQIPRMPGGCCLILFNTI